MTDEAGANVEAERSAVASSAPESSLVHRPAASSFGGDGRQLFGQLDT